MAARQKLSERDLVSDLFAAAIDAVEPRRTCARWLQKRRTKLDAFFGVRHLHILALGKAAEPMLRGAQDALAPNLAEGLAISAEP